MVIIMKWSWWWQVVKRSKVLAECCVFQGEEAMTRAELALAVEAKHPDYQDSFIAGATAASMDGKREER